MRGFVLARARQAVVVVVAVVTITFVLAHAVPGDPFWAIEDPLMTPAEREQLRAQWGYDLPVWQQYGRWIGNFAMGDFGWSHTRSQPVADVLRDAVPNTLLLMAPAIVVGMLAGIAVGTWQALQRGRASARFSETATLTLVSVPDFVIALLVLSLFAVKWRLFPVAGMIDPVNHDTLSAGGRLADVLVHLMLPAGTLAVLIAAPVSRYQRVAVQGVLQEEYLRTARAKGASERDVVLRHVLRNASGPVIAIGGLLIPGILSGAVFIEKIFAWPGMGLTVVNAVLGRDYALVQAVVVLSTILVLAANAAADMLAALVNPRTRLDA